MSSTPRSGESNEEDEEEENEQDAAALDRRTSAVFRRLDLNGDGVIDRVVFERSLRTQDPETWDDRRLVRRLLRAIDANGDGLVQREELRAWLGKDDDPWDEARESLAFADDAAEEGDEASSAGAADGADAEVFQRLDLKGDGVIDMNEFSEALLMCDPERWEDPHLVQSVFEDIDANGDGVLQFVELSSWLATSDRWDELRGSAAFISSDELAAMPASAQTPEVEPPVEVMAVSRPSKAVTDYDTRVIEVFGRLDINCDGVIDREEFGKALTGLDKDSWNTDTIERLFTAVDTNCDGGIQFQELSEWLNAFGDEWDDARASTAFALPIRRCVSSCFTNGKVSDFYTLDGDKVGEGSYGSVAQARHKVTQVARAVKTILKSRMDMSELESEISIMGDMDHPHILRLYEVFEDRHSIYMVMELCRGGELFNRIVEAESFSERQAAAVMRQITSGLRYMHENRVCHRDLKPENFLLRDRGPIEQCIVKIIDFGISCRFVPGVPMTERQGTLFYIAPEVLAGSYDQACDMWSCGVINYILLCGYPPFHGSDDEEILACIHSGKFQFHKEFWGDVSADAKDLIRWQLQFDPRHRCTAQQAMGHVWIKHQAPTATNAPLQQSQLLNMRAFAGQNRLKKAALRVIARELMDDQIQQLKDMFVSLDENGDGKVTFQELTDGIAKLEMPDAYGVISEVMKEMDLDGSGFIDYSEFLAAALDMRHYGEEKVCWAAFHAFDKDGDGTISCAELAMVLQNDEMEAVMGSNAVEAILAECDTDADGQISFDEFLKMMRKR